MIQWGRGTIQQRINDGKCPKCRAAWRPLKTENGEHCKVCDLVICNRNVENDDRQSAEVAESNAEMSENCGSNAEVASAKSLIYAEVEENNP
jgi:hypothetical protein